MKKLSYYTLTQNDDNYPSRLIAQLGPFAPITLNCAGPVELMSGRVVAVFCSRKCPGAAILHTYDVLMTLRHRPLAVISGYHSPMEKECMRALAQGTAGVIWCLPKAIECFQLPQEFDELYDAQRLLIVSAFDAKKNRVTRATSMRRNTIAAALADDAIFAYAAPESATECLCAEICDTDTHVCAIDIPENKNIFSCGAQPLSACDVPSLWPDV